MNDFDYDVRQKAIVARSARNVKRGSRTRYVSLPSDHMTTAEWKRRNGEVSTYDLGKPMTWKQLQAMPADLKKQYIEKLRREYNANAAALSEMLGVTANYLRLQLKEWGLEFPRGGAGRMRDEDRARWDVFINPKAKTPTPLAPEVEETPPPEEAQPTEKPGPAPARICAGTMVFRGSAGDAMRQVYAILGERNCKLTISWEAES